MMSPSASKNQLGLGLVQVLMFSYILSLPLLAGSESTARLSTVIGILLAVAFAAVTVLNGWTIRVPTELIVFGAFLIYSVVGGFHARDIQGFMSMAFRLFQIWLLLLILFNMLTIHRKAHMVGFRVFVWGVLGSSVLALMTSSGLPRRFAATFDNPNSYGLALVLAIGAVLLLPMRGRVGLLSRMAILSFLFWQIALTGSRKAILGGLLLLGLYGLLVLLKNSRRPITAFGITLLMFVLAFGSIQWLQTTRHWNRIENLGLFLRGEEAPDVDSRVSLIGAGIETWKEHPVFGVGTNQFRYYAPDFGLRETYSHSNPIEILANFGLVGAVLFYTIYLRLTLRLWSAWRRQRHAFGHNHNSHSLLMAMGLWVIWVGLEIARVSYTSQTHWVAVSLLMAMAFNLERSVSEQSPVTLTESPTSRLRNDPFQSHLVE